MRKSYINHNGKYIAEVIINSDDCFILYSDRKSQALAFRSFRQAYHFITMLDLFYNNYSKHCIIE